MKQKIFYGFLAGLLGLMIFSSVGQAAKYKIKEMTPEVSRALDGRRERYEQLAAFKKQGIIGENNKGYVEVISSNGEARTLAEAENQDRKMIYETIARQNNLGGALATIEKVFAEEQRERASSGDMIQTEDGRWVKKQ